MTSISKNDKGITVIETDDSVYTFQTGANVYTNSDNQIMSVKPSGNESALIIIPFSEIDTESRYGQTTLKDLIKYYADNSFFFRNIVDSDSPNGFIDYNDAATAITPIELAEDEWGTLTNDGQGVNTRYTYAPDGVNELFDTDNGHIDLSELELGDVVLIRNDFEITPTVNNSSLDFRYLLGDGYGQFSLPTSLPRLDLGAGISYRRSLTIDMIYAGSLLTKDNPIIAQVRCSSDATVKNNGLIIYVMKR